MLIVNPSIHRKIHSKFASWYFLCFLCHVYLVKTLSPQSTQTIWIHSPGPESPSLTPLSGTSPRVNHQGTDMIRVLPSKINKDIIDRYVTHDIWIWPGDQPWLENPWKFRKFRAWLCLTDPLPRLSMFEYQRVWRTIHGIHGRRVRSLHNEPFCIVNNLGLKKTRRGVPLHCKSHNLNDHVYITIPILYDTVIIPTAIVSLSTIT